MKAPICGGGNLSPFSQLLSPSTHVSHSELEGATRLNPLVHMCWHWLSLVTSGPYFISTSSRSLTRLVVQFSPSAHASLETSVCFEIDFTRDQEGVVLLWDWHKIHWGADEFDQYGLKYINVNKRNKLIFVYLISVAEKDSQLVPMTLWSNLIYWVCQQIWSFEFSSIVLLIVILKWKILVTPELCLSLH